MNKNRTSATISFSPYLGIRAKQTIAMPIIPNGKGETPLEFIIKRQIATLTIRTPLSKGLFINKL